MVPIEAAPAIPLAIFGTLLAAYEATLTAFIGAVALFGRRLGRVPTRQEYTELRNQLKADNAQLRQELKDDSTQLRQELKDDNAQLREEFRRRHRQLMLALVNHSHREDGQAVFTLPPELETTPAPTDN